jgi:hypothetical protein
MGLWSSTMLTESHVGEALSISAWVERCSDLSCDLAQMRRMFKGIVRLCRDDTCGIVQGDQSANASWGTTTLHAARDESNSSRISTS